MRAQVNPLLLFSPSAQKSCEHGGKEETRRKTVEMGKGGVWGLVAAAGSVSAAVGGAVAGSVGHRLGRQRSKTQGGAAQVGEQG